MGTWQRIRHTRFERTEIVFGSGTVLLAVVVGVAGPPIDIRIYVLFVLWAALVGMMVPRWLEARSATAELDVARSRAARQRVANHDMASALLTIEGGITALRCLYHEGQSHDPTDDVVAARVESVAHAIETEIRRIRRINSPSTNVTQTCSVHGTVEPLVSLHRATGVCVAVDLGRPTQVSMSSDDLARVVANLLDNCATHASAAPVSLTGFASADSYRLTIADGGPGLDADLVDRAFEHGVSSRPGGGLGLYSVRSIVETCGGSVAIKSSSTGTTVRLDPPVVYEASRTRARRHLSPRRRTKSRLEFAP